MDNLRFIISALVFSLYCTGVSAQPTTPVGTSYAGTSFPVGSPSAGPFVGPPTGAPLYVADRDAVSTAPATGATGAVNRTTPPIPMPTTASQKENTEKKADAKKPSAISAWWSSLFKKSSSKKQPKEEALEPDDGLDVVDNMRAERRYSGKDYVESATRGEGTTNPDFYSQGLEAESSGDMPRAAKLYNEFIKANKKMTGTGVLAAPYHRLALIAWKGGDIKASDVYFRYAIKYARGGNCPIIAGDYALFLMDQNNLAQAEVMLRGALANVPDNHRLLVYLGRCTARQNKPIEAQRHFAAALGPEQGYAELAHVYRQMGAWENAHLTDTLRHEYVAQRQMRDRAAAQYAARFAASNPPNSGVVLTPPRFGTQQAAVQPAIPATKNTATNTATVSLDKTSVDKTKIQTAAASLPAVTPTPKSTAAPQTVTFQTAAQQKPQPPVLQSITQPGWQAPSPSSAVAPPSVPLSGVFHYPAGANVPSPY